MNLIWNLREYVSSADLKKINKAHWVAIGFAGCLLILLVLFGTRVPQKEGQGLANASVAHPDQPVLGKLPSFSQDEKVVPVQPAPALPEVARPIAIPTHTELKGTLQQGETLFTALKRLGINTELGKQIVASLQGHLDFQNLQPGDEFAVLLNADGELLQCTYECGPLESFTVSKSSDGYTAAQDPVSLDCLIVKLSGTVKTSLFNTFYEFGEEAKLVYGFADIFSSQIDFNTEFAEGDRLSLIVEKYYKDETFVGYGRILMARYEFADGGKKPLEAFYFDSAAEARDGYFDRHGECLGTSFIRSPVPVAHVSSSFSPRRKHPILGIVRPHLGVDLAAPSGTPVLAAADGKVCFMGVNGGFGNQLVLEHANGYRTHYGHLSAFRKDLALGSTVKQKEVIGFIGATGLATGPHLDYRLERLGEFVNPFDMDFRPQIELGGEELVLLNLTVDIYSKLMDSGGDHQVLAAQEFTLAPESRLSLL